MVDDCLLVVSELVTNAVNAGCTQVGMSVEIHRGYLRVIARDDAPGEPYPMQAGPRDPNGRGLAIIACISSAWGVRPGPGGKQVWADLPIPNRLTRALDCSL